MEKIIAACGNDCAACPRHLPRSEEELLHTAELWKRIGYRSEVVSAEEISCAGCKPENWCRYDIIGCTSEKNISNCGECSEYPCQKIMNCFSATEKFRPSCEKACSREEYEQLTKAFFEKKKNLDEIAGKK